MPDPVDTIRKRAVLATARTQFSSTLQPLKQAALDQIVTNILFSLSSATWTTVDQVTAAFRKDSGGYALNHSDAQAALQRLVSAEEAERHPSSFTMYRLKPAARARIERIEEQAESRLTRILQRLFGADPSGHGRYRDCFLDIVSRVFGTLGEESARLVTMQDGHDNRLGNISLNHFVEPFRISCPDLDFGLLWSGLERFFGEDHPDHVEIKWNLAQNLFVTRFLGMDPSGALLSSDIFGNATFYIDTNVLVAALEPEDPGHGWFQSLAECVRLLGAQMCVCAPTLRELSSFVDGQRADVVALSAEVPPRFQENMDSIFVRKYHATVKRGEHPDIDELFATVKDAKGTLQTRYGIEVEDDPWFHRAIDDGRLDGFAKQLQDRQASRGKDKRVGAARHDALVLTWIENQREEFGSSVWFVTTDGSLPGAVPADSEARSLAVLASTLMQWISPMVGSADESRDFRAGFSRMISERVLPREQFMEARHFRVLVELGVDLKAMPEEEVERIYNDLKVQAPMLDVSQPTDREKLTLIVQTGLADLDIKARQNLAREEQAARLRAEEAAAQSLKRQEERFQAERRHFTEQLEAEQKRHQRKLAEISAERQREDRLRFHRTRAQQGKVGVWLTGFAILVTEMAALWAVNSWGAGINLLQKVANTWVIFPIIPAVLVGIAGAIIGRERLAAVGWPFSQWFGVSEDATIADQDARNDEDRIQAA